MTKCQNQRRIRINQTPDFTSYKTDIVLPGGRMPSGIFGQHGDGDGWRLEHQISPKISLKQKLQIIVFMDYLMDQILITKKTKFLNLVKCKNCNLTCHECTILQIAHYTHAQHCGILIVISCSYWCLGDTPTWTGQ